MDTTWPMLVAAGFAGAIASAVASRWWYGRALAAMQRRLEKVEQVRQATHERSLQARQQIAQLSQAIADLQRRHKGLQETQRKRAELERMVPASVPTLHTPADGFADTQPLSESHAQAS